MFQLETTRDERRELTACPGHPPRAMKNAMTSPLQELPLEIKRRQTFVLAVWIALTLCSGLLGLIAQVARFEGTAEGPRAAATFLAMAALMLVSTLTLSFYALSEPRLKAFADQRLQGLEPRQAASRLFRHWTMISFFAWSLNESIASLGLVISSVAKDLSWAASAFAAVAVLLNLASYPRFASAARKAGLLAESPSEKRS